MKTIVINTSKESNNTKLDVLFKASFDKNALLWYDHELNALGEVPEIIKQALINETDTINKDYNLIVLVDLFDFPRSDDKIAARLYKGLMVKYIENALFLKLNNSYDLLPKSAAIYFADSAKVEKGFDISSLADNYKDQEEQQRKEILENAVIAEKRSRKRSDLVEEPDIAPKKTQKLRSTEEKLLMELFSWTEEMGKADIQWKLKISSKEEIYIDFSEVYSEISFSISKGHKTAKVTDGVLEAMADITTRDKARFTASDAVKMESLSGFSIWVHSCNFNRDNEEGLIKGFFELLANVFLCVQSGSILTEVKEYSKDEIRELFTKAFKKYKHFANERNIDMDFEPIIEIFNAREAILRERKKISARENEFKDSTPDEVAELIMKETRSPKSDITEEGVRVKGLDRRFHHLVAEIEENYDPETIKTQNNKITRSCLVGLWNWRDRQTSEDFRATVDAVVSKGKNTSGIKEVELSRERIDFIEEQHEEKYSELIKEVTEAEYRLAGNTNILDSAKALAIKYSDLMRKGRKYLLSFIGAIVAIVIMVLPYIYVEYYSGGDNAIFATLYYIFTLGFVFLYATASGIYIAVIRRKKLALIEELARLKADSEAQRKESIAALYKYYSSTVIETETCCLLWREILIRNKENSRKSVKRNNHIKRLEHMGKEILRFATMIKLDLDKKELEITPADIEYFESEGFQLFGEESFYHPCNMRVYSILPDVQFKTEIKEEA